MRIVFMGTPDFAVPCLKRLVDDGNEVVGVFTQPDKPKGRGYTLTPPPVKVFAEENGFSVFQPKSMREGEALEILKRLNPELNVVTAYGKILPPEILYLPKFCSINIHASLLPKYRGAAPIQWCILNGEKETGVTSMLMNEGLDTGDMLISEKLPIDENMTAGELHDKLSLLGADVLSKTIRALLDDSLTPIKQNDDESCYSPMLTKALSPIDITKTIDEVHNKIRGLAPWPTATAVLGGKKVKLHSSEKTELKGGAPGEITVSHGKMLVACKDGKLLKILELQPEGKKRMSAEAFLLGHNIQSGDSFK